MGINKLEPRKPQTKVKHEILQKYIGPWGGIILSGKSNYPPSQVTHFVYVDCDGSYGRYDGELEDKRAGRVTPYPVYGSPIIGIQELDKLADNARGLRVRTNAIIIEKDAGIYRELKKSLELAGYGARVRETRDFHSLRDGEIALVSGDSTRMAPILLNYTQKSRSTYALYLIDPYGPSGVPLKRFVAPIISSDRHDVIVYMPYYDLHKKSGLITKPHLTDDEMNRIHHNNEMFDDNGEWQRFAIDIDPRLQQPLDFRAEGDDMMDPDNIDPLSLSLSREREDKLVEHYKRQLESKDRDVIVKKMRLPFPECDLTMYYLFLTTHNETGALVMNKILYDAGLLSSELRQRLRDVTKRPAAQLVMFDPADMEPTTKKPPRPSTEDIANDIYARIFMGRQSVVTLRDTYKALAHEIYFVGEVARALTLLKKQGRISPGPDMGHNTSIRSGTA